MEVEGQNNIQIKIVYDKPKQLYRVFICDFEAGTFKSLQEAEHYVEHMRSVAQSATGGATKHLDKKKDWG